MAEHYICIHGHFYQPPRESPWTGVIDHQASAAPYHDWNQRITAECYAPNAAARILDAAGQTARVINNYEWMSFNFGPTLLRWMEREAPDTYRRIVQADRASVVRFGGHGSAIAQAFHHAILPLANLRDKVTEVRWGIADFEHRFGRSPEGMWLPECAVDIQTLEVLAQAGIAYTILSPGQASSVRAPHQYAWHETMREPVDTRRAYVQQLPSGRRIALFFYEGKIAQEVAFNGLLNSGDVLRDRLLCVFDEREGSQLAHIATDGETYGHHHPHGEMALAYAVHTLVGGAKAELTNYGHFPERSPPQWEARIADASSWSCAHGVGRWERDCGCHIGGLPEWNQAWRVSLRSALNDLRDKLAHVYEERAGDLVKDPWAARNDYIGIILTDSVLVRERFFDRHSLRALTTIERERVIALLDLQKYALMMFTSCAWFFDDISGIETVQILRYAARAIQISRETCDVHLEDEFVKALQSAQSSIPKEGTGAEIYRKGTRGLVTGATPR